MFIDAIVGNIVGKQKKREKQILNNFNQNQ
jgi:hypothetical protein